MPAALLTIVFWTAVVAAVIAQVMILRSSARVLRATRRPFPFTEWGFALGPALVLALVLVLSWRAAMRPAAVEVQVMPLQGEIRS